MPASGSFTDDSPLRQVVGDRMTGLSGPRALLMMAAHPVAFEGFFAHTGALDDPYARLQRTAVVMNAVAFGPRDEAERLTRRVRAMHARVRGSLSEHVGRFPAGTPYRGDDPELLLWILASLADSAMLVYSKYVRRLDAEERDALWQDYRVVGRHFGLAGGDMPADADAFDAYMDAMLASGDLHVSDRARELATGIVLRPPVPPHLRPLLELVNQITFGLLPSSVRRMYGFSWDPIRALALHGGAEYLKRVVVPVLPERVRMLPVAR
ncbi:MAG TPA: oxygenase MpaB family protein [Solirubrobacteraceae bacterium]|nr:oxygenase MpaB family protein [Solirubrobacteraceae bacterium]